MKERYENMHLAEGKDQDYFEDLLAFGSILPLLEDTVTFSVRHGGLDYL